MKVELRKWRFSLMAGFWLSAFVAQAMEFVQRDEFISSAAETLRNELWVSAQNITISGQALDDLFAAGGTLDLRGIFTGDVWAGGDKVIAAGRFKDHVRLVSRTIQVSGILDGSLLAVGNTVKVEPSATIGGNLLCLGENVVGEGSVAGDARIVAQSVTLGGHVAGDISIAAQKIAILSGTVIDGNLSYTAPQELVLAPSVALAGKLIRTFEIPKPKPSLKPSLVGHFLFAVAALLTGLVFSALFPRYMVHANSLLRTTSGLCFLTGLVGLFLIPLAAFVLLFTLVGLPLSLMVLLFYLILLYLSKIAVGFWLGGLVLRRKEISKANRFGVLFTGLLILYFLTAFTAVSMVVSVLTALFGLGALLLALFRKPVLEGSATCEH